MFSIFFFIFCFSLECITIHFLCSILLFLLMSPCSSVCFSTSRGNKKDPSAESRVRVFTFEKWLLSFIFSHATPLSLLYLLPVLLECSWEHSCPRLSLELYPSGFRAPVFTSGHLSYLKWTLWRTEVKYQISFLFGLQTFSRVCWGCGFSIFLLINLVIVIWQVHTCIPCFLVIRSWLRSYLFSLHINVPHSYPIAPSCLSRSTTLGSIFCPIWFNQGWQLDWNYWNLVGNQFFPPPRIYQQQRIQQWWAGSLGSSCIHADCWQVHFYVDLDPAFTVPVSLCLQ